MVLFFTLAVSLGKDKREKNPEGDRDKFTFLKKCHLLNTPASTNLIELNLSSVNKTIFLWLAAISN